MAELTFTDANELIGKIFFFSGDVFSDVCLPDGNSQLDGWLTVDAFGGHAP